MLLGVLEERLLVLPVPNQNESYIKVHPNFRVIFTSNPQEYAGVHDAQDALGDRMVMIDVDYFDRDTEIAITAARSGLPRAKVTPIVDLVREYRDTGEYDQTPTLRSSIMICRMMAQEKLRPTIDDPHFVQVCIDILGSKSMFTGKTESKRTQQQKMLLSLIEHHCPSQAASGAGRRRTWPMQAMSSPIGGARRGDGQMPNDRAITGARRPGGLRNIATLLTLANGAKPRERHQIANRFARLENERARLDRELGTWDNCRRATAIKLGEGQRGDRRAPAKLVRTAGASSGVPPGRGRRRAAAETQVSGSTAPQNRAMTLEY